MNCKHEFTAYKFGRKCCEHCDLEYVTYLEQQLTTAQDNEAMLRGANTELLSQLELNIGVMDRAENNINELQEENVRFRRLLKELYNDVKECDQVLLEDGTHYYEVGRIDLSFMKEVEHALSTLPTGGLSELVEAVGKRIEKDCNTKKERNKYCGLCNSNELCQAYNKVIGGE